MNGAAAAAVDLIRSAELYAYTYCAGGVAVRGLCVNEWGY